MKKNELNHALTPEPLRSINQEIAELLEQEDDGQKYAQLLGLVESRDNIIQSHLNALDGEPRRHFAEQELEVNNRLMEMAQSLLKSAKQDVTQFVRSQAAIKKYK
ncbi:hypothetical protein DXV75_10440 [Alteromonas aestuariivivens]|uniref:Flagellar protein FliT n=1 Tax=Alteromonas aestuariivivens TaxID=1938339 RepID=A0A3D8M5Z1_9ALTE|nr:hypothetical protein [Alteromonas aestuariivivens]RDV25041.1 hypothetical protein DXV75_10440 [Alteromonas aestuariivivens]